MDLIQDPIQEMIQEKVQDNEDVVKDTIEKKGNITSEMFHEIVDDFVVKNPNIFVLNKVTVGIKKRQSIDQVTSTTNKMKIAQYPLMPRRLTRSMAKQLVSQQSKKMQPLLIEDSSTEERVESPFNKCPDVTMELEPDLQASGGWLLEGNSCHISVEEPIAPSSP